MEITHVTYQGPPIDDPAVLEQVPAELASLLRQINGYIQFGGALHIRGATKHPSWHSLRLAFEGPHALQSLYPTVLAADVPFAQDCVGDQYLLRANSVLLLSAETGDIEQVADSLSSFLENVQANPVEFLTMQPLLDFLDSGKTLAPGRLLHVYPPFCVKTEASPSIRDVPAEELLHVHAEFAAHIRNLPDGAQIKLGVSD